MRKFELQEIHHRLLRFTGENRIATNETAALQLLGGRDEQALDTIDAAVQTLKGKYVDVLPLFGAKKYLILTKVGARLIGFHEEAAKPLGNQALAKHYAILQATSMRVPGFKRQNRPDLQKIFPDFWEEALSNRKAFYSDYYAGGKGQEYWLGRMQVDFGGDPTRFAVSSEEIVSEMKARPGLNQLIECGVLRLTIISGDQVKKESIEIALKSRSIEIPTYVYVIPELLNLIGQAVLGKNAKREAVQEATSAD